MLQCQCFLKEVSCTHAQAKAVMNAYTKPTEKPSWRLGKKEIITLVILLGLFICAVTVSQMRGSEEDTETETMN